MEGMRMTKHTPATPLPWKAVGPKTAEQHVIMSATENVGAFLRIDADYAAHAANAYPKLVEALRTVAPIIERFAAEADPQNSVLDQRRDELRALLRELGEE
jgi:hypothetical protein